MNFQASLNKPLGDIMGVVTGPNTFRYFLVDELFEKVYMNSTSLSYG
jgi:hypothetical protein